MEEVREDLYWDGENSVYVFEDVQSKGGEFYMPVIKRSLEGQDFNDHSDDYGSYETVLKKSNEIEARQYDDTLELDFKGTRLSGLKEDPELAWAINLGHTGNADSLERLLEAEENQSYSPLYQ